MLVLFLDVGCVYGQRWQSSSLLWCSDKNNLRGWAADGGRESLLPYPSVCCTMEEISWTWNCDTGRFASLSPASSTALIAAFKESSLSIIYLVS